MSIIYSMTFLSGSVLSYNNSYLTQDPTYLCKKTPEGDYESCTKDEICELGNWKIDWSDNNSLDNWITQFGWNCQSAEAISLLSSIYYLGYSFGCLFIPRLTDKNIKVMTCLSFFLGVVCVARYNGCYITVYEFSPEKYKYSVSTMLLIFESLLCIFTAVYCKYISRNWLYLQIFGVAISGLSIIGLWFIPETPEYLYSLHRFSECKYVCKKIAKFNGKSLEQKYVFDNEQDLNEMRFEIVTAGSNYKKSKLKDQQIRLSYQIQASLKTSFREFLQDKSNVRNLIVNVLLWMITIVAYTIIVFHGNYFPSDYYDSYIAGLCVELFAYIIGELLYAKTTGKKFFFFSYTLAGVFGSFILISQEYPEMMASFMSRFFISLTYTGIYMSNSVFPVLFSSTTFGVCNFFAGLAGMLSYEVILKLDDPIQVSIMIVLCLGGGMISIFLKE
ncbi:solute carrier family member 5 [Stylonychia lemnae]|uniref:Solute carrier family member 5 n=1 Tax=Stylonychia lemnae TaxID=5949 RepID=A0A078B4M8_STYLE|nr:solute carrier family member 5 [Stylonychia lemnae]|eukprot:CDW88182.1 solute carrier family member 5 [Stylonychia lemnae]